MERQTRNRVRISLLFLEVASGSKGSISTENKRPLSRGRSPYVKELLASTTVCDSEHRRLHPTAQFLEICDLKSALLQSPTTIFAQSIASATLSPSKRVPSCRLKPSLQSCSRHENPVNGPPPLSSAPRTSAIPGPPTELRAGPFERSSDDDSAPCDRRPGSARPSGSGLNRSWQWLQEKRPERRHEHPPWRDHASRWPGARAGEKLPVERVELWLRHRAWHGLRPCCRRRVVFSPWRHRRPPACKDQGILTYILSRGRRAFVREAGRA